MTIDDQVMSWIDRPDTKIRRTGELSHLEVAELTTAYFENGSGLLSDARYLLAEDRWERGAALIVLGLEELAKIKIVTEAFLKFEKGEDKEAWKKYWKSGGNHRTKQKEILSYGNVVKNLFNGEPIHSRYLYRYYASAEVFEQLDWFKQSNLYVDLRTEGIHRPSVSSNSKKLSDYLLAFALERADSYGSWHVSERRAQHFLKLALGEGKAGKWTNSFTVDEIEADILYQASARSASLVPDYASFHDYVKTIWNSHVAEKRIKKALLGTANELRKRMQQSEKMPLFRDRFFGTYKLVFAVSQSGENFSGAFLNELSEAMSLK